MRTSKLVLIGTIALAAPALLGTQCPPIPEIQERIVELAVSSAITVEFDAAGTTNTIDDTRTVDIGDSVNIREIVSDADVNVDDVIDIAVSGVAYRVIEPDPNPDRMIENGEVDIQRGSGTREPLVTSFNARVNDATDYQDAPLNEAGVNVINAILDELLLAAQEDRPANNVSATFYVTGQSTPPDQATDFRWEIKIFFTIVGTIEVDVPEF